MPCPNAGPGSVLFGPDDKYGAKPKKGVAQYLWYIVWSERGKKRELSTGASFEHREAAEGVLADFLASRALKWSGARQSLDQVTIADVLCVYGEEARADYARSRSYSLLHHRPRRLVEQSI